MRTNLMVFIAGDNDLDTFGTTDIEEMMSVQDTGDKLTILVQQDQSVLARDSSTKRYVIRHGKKIETIHLGETNTGEVSTLREFIEWGLTEHEAERNIVVLWNHGGGTRDEEYPQYNNNQTTIENIGRVRLAPSRAIGKATVRAINANPTLGNQASFFPQKLRLKRIDELMEQYQRDRGETVNPLLEVESKSILFDDESRDFLDNLELKRVFEGLDKKIDIVGFDACLMGMMEVAYQLKEHAEVIIGSEELEPGKGWDYEAIVRYLVANPKATNEEVSKEIIRSFIDSYADQDSLKVTLSSIRTSKLDNVACLMNNFAHTILRKESNIRSTFLAIVDGTQTFDYQNNEQIYRDLKHFVLLTNAHYKDDEEICLVSDNLLKGLESVVVENQTNNFEHAHGLSVYLPLMPNMSGFAIAVFSALDLNAKDEAPYWLKLFKQIGNLDTEANQCLGAEALETCVDDFRGLYFTTSFIKEGHKDKVAIKQLQALLNLLGERLVVDGDFGAKSTQSVKKFQESNGLVVDGKVGEKSWYKLYEVALERSQVLIDEVVAYEFLSLSSNNRKLTLWLQSLLYLLDRTTVTTSIYNKELEERVVAFQITTGIDINGCTDEQTWQKLFESVHTELEKIDNLLLKDDFITEKALEHDLSPAVIKAVIKVESRGRGFNREKKPVILFEGHIFWRKLKEIGLNPHTLVEGNEDIIFKSPNYKFYNHAQYPRLEKAKTIDEEAALKSASYGMFQVMGFNHTLTGFDSVFEMVEYMSKSEKNQLEVFMSFLKNTACYNDLKAKDWASFARHYNGSMYKRNQYDVKLEQAYNNARLTKGIAQEIDEEAYISMYALELEKAFYKEKE